MHLVSTFMINSQYKWSLGAASKYFNLDQFPCTVGEAETMVFTLILNNNCLQQVQSLARGQVVV